MNQNKFSILYAEDDERIREKYAKFLRLYFKDVYEATNGQEALELYEENKPDVIILDINMPVVNGLEVAKIIRRRDKETQLIILSAYSDREKLLAATELLLTKYLVKPIQSFELEEIIVKCIHNLQARDDKESLLYLDGDFIWSKEEETLSKGNVIFKLTQKELLLLKLFCSKPNLTFSNIDILNYVWEDDIQSDFNTNKLRIVFSKLKTKLSFNLFSSQYNVGYKINQKRNI
ncbi:response regulator transcription factor [Sulfurimonas sp.]|uniref:response regulator transcription factor n=1 Tax=Sulfurimonas sp. TaxID=2022749 RepID=UPI00356233B2